MSCTNYLLSYGCVLDYGVITCVNNYEDTINIPLVVQDIKSYHQIYSPALEM